MTGKEWKVQLEAAKLQEKAEQVIIDFLRKHQQDSLVFENVNNVRSWLSEIYPDIWDESEHDEEIISAFVAGMVWIMINATSDTKVRWIYAYEPPEDEEEGDGEDSECD